MDELEFSNLIKQIDKEIKYELPRIYKYFEMWFDKYQDYTGSKEIRAYRCFGKSKNINRIFRVEFFLSNTHSFFTVYRKINENDAPYIQLYSVSLLDRDKKMISFGDFVDLFKVERTKLILLLS